MPDAVTYASEEAKIEALDKIPETPENLAEIQRIMEIPVTPTEKPAAEKPEEPPKEDTTADKPPAAETPKAEPPKPGDTIAIPRSELPEEYRNFDDAGKLLKKIKNQDETIARQTQFIKEKLQSRDSGVEDQIEQVRRENEELRKQVQARHDAGQPPAGDSQRRAAASQSKINDIIQKRKALLQKHADVEDQQFNAEFIKEKNSLDDMMLDEMVRLNSALESMSGDVQTAKTQAHQAIAMRSENDEAERTQKAFEDQVKEIQTFTDTTDGFKLSKPFMELDKEYGDYQKQVAAVYWGRQPKDGAETKHAMDQLLARSPSLINNLQAAGIAIEPSDDMQRYLAACEVWDKWQGIRKNPQTGDYDRNPKTGAILPKTRYDPTTRQWVRDTYPSVKAAYNDDLVESGHYTRKIIEAFKAGGKSLAEARARRDGGAVELDNSTGGKPRISAEAALEDIQKVDEVEAVLRAKDGDPGMLKRYNDNALILGWPQLSV